jgi:hypothetical protein
LRRGKASAPESQKYNLEAHTNSCLRESTIGKAGALDLVLTLPASLFCDLEQLTGNLWALVSSTKIWGSVGEKLVITTLN